MIDFCHDSHLWDANLTLSSNWPQLTSCFQSTVLVWVVTGWIWVISPLYLYYLCSQKTHPNKMTWKFITKVTLVVAEVSLHFIEVISEVVYHSPGDVWKASVVAPSLRVLTQVLVLLFILLERWKGFVTSGVLFIYWTASVIVGVIPFYSKIITQEHSSSIIPFVIYYITYSMRCVQLVLSCFADNESVPINKDSCPIFRSSWASRISFWWMNGFMIKGFKNPLTEDDLFGLPSNDIADTIAIKFEKHWKQTRHMLTERSDKYSPKKSKNDTDETGTSLLGLHDRRPISHDTRYSLIRAIIASFGMEVLFIQFLNFIRCICVFINPVLLRLLIDFIESSDLGVHSWRGYVIAVSMFLASLLETILMTHIDQGGRHLGNRINAALLSKIYKKALTMSNQSRKTSSVGEIINLMSVDSALIQEKLVYLRGTWDCILQISVAFYFLYQQVGYAMFAGCGVLLLTVPIKIFCMSKTFNVHIQQMKDKDSRIKLLTEVLNGIKVLKLYTWEMTFKEKIKKIRNIELKGISMVKLYERIQETFFHVTPFLVSFTTFVTYIHISDQPLDAQKVFVSLALFNILKYTIDYSSYVFRDLLKIIVSLKRINKFLNVEDIAEDNVKQDGDQDKIVVSIKNGTFMWDADIGEILKGINIDIYEGSLVAIVGQVGQGKSSLLSAMLGEMVKMSGHVSVKGSVAYVPQQAWIQNATVKNNVLFGSSLDMKKYQKIIDACALTSDLEILPAGDGTEIGEKGINLSGGQKQRVSLARAVYNDADIFYLDDPLSAVDSHVGKHIFDQVIGNNGLLKNKTRILVTHGIQWLPKVDRIIVLTDGSISEVGTYDELLDHAGPFAEFLQNYLMEHNETDSEDEGVRVDVLQRLTSITSSEGSTFDLRHSRTELHQKEIGSNPCFYDMMKMEFNRQMSETKTADKSIPNGDVTKPEDTLIEEEVAEVGKKLYQFWTSLFIVFVNIAAFKTLFIFSFFMVKMNLFMAYFRALGIPFTLLMGFCYALSEGMSVMGNFWLAKWTDDPILKSPHNITNTSYSLTDRNVYFSGIYVSFGVGQAITILVFGITFNFRIIVASRLFHNRMLHTIVRAPISFFDTTPVGRIINRFSRDIEMIDWDLPWTMEMWIFCFVSVIGSLIVISYSAYWFLLVVVPIIIFYFSILRFYIPTSRQLRRIESKLRSPIFNYFSETISGACVIRAFKFQKSFEAELHKRVDIYHRSMLATLCCDSWKGLRLELLGNLVILAAAIFSVAGKGSVSAGIVGLSLTYALQITRIMNWLLILLTLMETNVVSVERVMEYTEKETEEKHGMKVVPIRITTSFYDVIVSPVYDVDNAFLKLKAELIKEDCRPPEGWLKKGEIVFNQYSTRYRPGLDLVLKDIKARILPGEKVGIVGRTGAGKSSLTLAMFRLIEPASGSIEIDGENISYMGLHDCRSKITILPQDPVLFSGSLRMNLDPLDTFSDDEIWRALAHAHLKPFVETLPSRLEYECGEGGNNLSVGQKQLVCLGRSLLQKTKILILDEATAAVDLETDSLIQQTIREEFKDCTVLTIAHRLNTVIDYDRIMVLDKGIIKEFDTPQNLLSNTSGLFYQLAKDAGLAS